MDLDRGCWLVGVVCPAFYTDRAMVRSAAFEIACGLGAGPRAGYRQAEQRESSLFFIIVIVLDECYCIVL